MAGRQFQIQDKLVSVISRRSIDLLKEYFNKQVTPDEWIFIRDKLKKFYNIL